MIDIKLHDTYKVDKGGMLIGGRYIPHEGVAASLYYINTVDSVLLGNISNHGYTLNDLEQLYIQDFGNVTFCGENAYIIYHKKNMIGIYNLTKYGNREFMYKILEKEKYMKGCLLFKSKWKFQDAWVVNKKLKIDYRDIPYLASRACFAEEEEIDCNTGYTYLTEYKNGKYLINKRVVDYTDIQLLAAIVRYGVDVDSIKSLFIDSDSFIITDKFIFKYNDEDNHYYDILLWNESNYEKLEKLLNIRK